MLDFLSVVPLEALLVAFAAALFAGVVKGMVGFGMPMIIVSTTASLLSPELSIAALLLPTLASNGYQAFRQGAGQAVATIREFKWFLIVGGAILVLVAQLVTNVPQNIFFLTLGSFVTLFSVLQLLGWLPNIPARTTKTDVAVAAICGVTGGMSGIWGPPTVTYLTAVNTPKLDQIRIQGVIYGLGAVALFAAHIKSGLLTPANTLFSAALVVPAMVGTFLGTQFNNRIDQRMFRKLTLIVLVLAGLNLLRRGAFGA